LAGIAIMGHSLGAALATIMATDFMENGFDRFDLYTYGSPRVGDKNFYEWF